MPFRDGTRSQTLSILYLSRREGSHGTIRIASPYNAHDFVGCHHSRIGSSGDLPRDTVVEEDDQIFIDAAEQHHYQEQQAIIQRITRLTKPIIALAVLSGGLLLASASVWLYRGFKSF
jgi:hypothetical protein